VCRPHAAAAPPSRAEAEQSVAVQVKVVAAGEPDDQIALGVLQAEAQGSPPQGDLGDVLGEVLVVTVAFAAALAAAFQLLAGVEDQVELVAMAVDVVDALGSDEAVQVLEGADTLTRPPQPL